MATKAMSYFRKHQKVILACITIGTMLIFIVGDAVQSIARGGSASGGIVGWFSNFFSGGTKEDTVFRVAGVNYDPMKITQLQEQRLFAADVMRSVTMVGEQRLMESLGFKEEDLRDQSKWQKMNEAMSKDPSVADARTARDKTLLNQIKPSIVTFYEGGLRELPESIVEYLLMRNKANDLGVTITTNMVRDDLVKLGMNRVTLDEINLMVRNSARQRGMLNMAKLDSVLAVLADEVKVSIAKNVNQEDISRYVADFSQQRGMPMRDRSRDPQITPADLWKAYVDVKTSLSTGILPMKVEDFINKIPDPTPEEKQAYFDKYKTAFPSSDKDTPGFKIPPMYRIGFVLADMKEGQPADKHYRGMVDAWDKLAPFTALAELAKAYNDKKDTQYRTLKPFLEFPLALKAGSPWIRFYQWQFAHDHAQVASSLGHAMLGMTQVGTLSPVNGFAMNAAAEIVPADQVNIVQKLSKEVALAATPLGAFLPSEKLRSGAKENFVPFEVVVKALIDQRIAKQAKVYLSNDLAELTTLLSDYGKKYNDWRSKVLRKIATSATPPLYKDEPKQSLQDFLAAFTKARGLSYYETKDLRSKDDLLNEPGERLLNTWIKPIYVGMFPEARVTKRDFDNYIKGRLVPDSQGKPKLFDALNSSASDQQQRNKEIVLHWISDATEAANPTLKDVDAAVVKAWKMEKARALVEEEAQKLIKDVNASPDNYRKLIDMKGYTPGQTLSRFSEPEIKSMADASTLLSAVLPPVLDNVDREEFMKQCLEKLKKKGDMTVIPDKSKSYYYLVYLANRSEPRTSNPLDIEAFHNEVIRPSINRPLSIDGTPFKTFVTQTVKNDNMKNWFDYLKEITSFNAELAKNLSERMRQ
ncbi:MAG: hypothetical protein U0796_20790 [Gemmatales bacterium]